MEWRRLQNEKLHDLYYSPDIIGLVKLRKVRREGFEARMDRRRAYWFLVGKPEGRGQPGKHRSG